MWETLLGVSVKSVRESFLDVGGSSLLVLQLSWRMEQQWGVRVSMSAIFDHPTIEDLAGLVRRLRTQSDG
jgi:acyl carrier protein